MLGPLFKDVLGYSEDRLRWAQPVEISFGRERKTKEADLVVYHDNKPVVTVEAKRPTESLQRAIGQVDSYAFALQTPYSVLTNGKHFMLRGYYSFNSRLNVIDDAVADLETQRWTRVQNLISSDNIASSMSEPSEPVRSIDEEKIRDYRRFFRKLHNEIRDRDKLDPAAAFDELSKLLFLKAAEDEWSRKRGRSRAVLTQEKIEEWEELGRAPQMVTDWFRAAITELFPDIFESDPRIGLSTTTLKELLSTMKPFHVRNGEVDVKGRAFEEFLPSQLRGKGLGQFFTPRPIVDFMVNMAGVSTHDIVVDFACGSGGFLIKAFEQMQQSVEQYPDGILRRLGITRDEMLKTIKEHQLFGIDAEPRAARTAKMNMLMWGDGDRVVRGNALDTKDFRGKPYDATEYDPQTPESGCTLILANPPFGSKEKDKDILRRYELGSKQQDRKSEKTEILFLERGLRMLRPEGRMLIVIPQGIMSGSSNARVRDLIHSEAEVRAVVSLPTHTFVQSGVPTVNTCVLFVQKFTSEKKAIYDEKTAGLDIAEIRELLRTDSDFDYPIFMGSAEFIGYEPSGRMTDGPGEPTDLDLLLADFEHQADITTPDVDVFAFASEHYKDKPMRKKDQVVRGTTKGLKTSFVVQFSKTEERLDPPFYLLRYQAGELLESLPTLVDRVKPAGQRFKPESEEQLDAEYPIVSVSSDGKVTLGEYRLGEQFNPKYVYKRLAAGNIVYNPSRANIGSIGVVPKELDGALASPEYVVFDTRKTDPNYLVDLLRSPFYRMYIDVVSTGSIRDRLYYRDLKQLRVPKVPGHVQEAVVAFSQGVERSTDALTHQITSQRSRLTASLHGLVTDPNGESIDDVAQTQSTDPASKFEELAEQWILDRPRGADIAQSMMHPAYQQIIGMGESAIRPILARLQRKSEHWFWALYAITGENPVPSKDEGRIKKMAESWINWGRERGYVA